eukprot:TRINITY_DN28731_c0_g1_i4.p1 TRINITY_DN28731_c0_g1~~TRINITY_DN28731_c0_g1_i4.p1  ORF type:complete len:188 (-),score=34.36 TRINITY_DN28731_c0_g1_i4:214-777(-)
MPVAGLPTALEVSLDALLHQHHLTSWKITGEGESTVVVIRLRNGQAVDNMACQQQQRVTPQYFRKKAPCQVNRDRRRAEERRSATAAKQEDVKASDDFDSENLQPLFMPTPPRSNTVSNYDTQPANNTPPECAREIRPVSSDATVLDIARATNSNTRLVWITCSQQKTRQELNVTARLKNSVKPVTV